VPPAVAAAAGATDVPLSMATLATVATPVYALTSGLTVRGTIVVINHEDPEATDRHGATEAGAGAGPTSSFRVG